MPGFSEKAAYSGGGRAFLGRVSFQVVSKTRDGRFLHLHHPCCRGAHEVCLTKPEGENDVGHIETKRTTELQYSMRVASAQIQRLSM